MKNGIETKKCSKCGEIKPLDLFYNGHNSCKMCYKLQCDLWVEKNKDKVKKYRQKWAEDNPEKNRNVRNKSYAKWRKNNPEKQKQRDKFIRTSLKDCYIRHLLFERSFKPNQITPDLIAAERALIKLKRAVRGIEA